MHPHSDPTATSAIESATLHDDRFADDTPAGRVVGHAGPSGPRLGRDRERGISIGDGSARFRYLEVPGWDRQSLAFGPIDPVPGLATCWHILNAHNTSMTHADRPIGRRERVRRFIKGLPQIHAGEPDIDDNLAVGWWNSPTESDPRRSGWSMLMHGADTLNGQLRVNADDHLINLATGFQNLPIRYAQVMRRTSVVHLVATSLPTWWAPVAPDFRAVGVDHRTPDEAVFCAVHQSIQGEVNYRIDTLIDSSVAVVDDSLARDDALTNATWRQDSKHGDWTRSGDELIVENDIEPGLVVVECTARIHISVGSTSFAADPVGGYVQIPIDGHGIAVDGSSLPVTGSRSTISFAPAESIISIEVFPAAIALPQLVTDRAWSPPESDSAVPSLPLVEGLLREADGWERTVGSGEVDLSGEGGGSVRANLDIPNPGRTLHTVAWHDPRGADVRLRQQPPGRRGEGHRGRSGICVIDDADNQLVINNWLDDTFDGASISCFFRIDGHEKMYDYDAVWSNVGHAVAHGVEHELRLVVDGIHIGIWVDDEPVMYRRITDLRAGRSPMRINRVGVASNWEWGDDTGTRFSSFEARSLRS